jgi:hypothetical protein
MKSIHLSLLIILSILCLVMSCRQVQTLPCGGLGCPTPYTGIMANNAPFIPHSFNLILVAVTTDSSLYSEQSYCGFEGLYYVSRFPNTNGSNQPVTFVSGFAAIVSATGVIFDNDTLALANCAPYGDYVVPTSTTLSLSSHQIWKVEYAYGDSTYIDSSITPVAPTITNSYSIPTNSSFTLQGTGPVVGDSVIFLIAGSKKTYRMTLPPGSLSCSFTSAQMDSVGTTTSSNPGLLQIATYHISQQGSMTLVKEACFSKYVQLR